MDFVLYQMLLTHLSRGINIFFTNIMSIFWETSFVIQLFLVPLQLVRSEF